MQVDKIYDNRKPGLDPLQIYPPVIFHPSMYFTVFSGTYLGYRNKLSTDRCHFFQPVCYQTTNKQIIGSHLVQWNEKKIFTRLFRIIQQDNIKDNNLYFSVIYFSHKNLQPLTHNKINFNRVEIFVTKNSPLPF